MHDRYPYDTPSGNFPSSWQLEVISDDLCKLEPELLVEATPSSTARVSPHAPTRMNGQAYTLNANGMPLRKVTRWFTSSGPELMGRLDMGFFWWGYGMKTPFDVGEVVRVLYKNLVRASAHSKVNKGIKPETIEG